MPRPDDAPVEVQRADGVVWRRHWSLPDRLVIEFVDLTDVEVDAASGRVTFDTDLPPDLEQHLLLDHVLPLVLARRGALVLHGGVISLGGAGAVLVGATGAGKSTLTAFAWQRGWTVGGDDGAVVTAGAPPQVEPTYATIRLTADTAEMLGIEREPGSEVVSKTRVARRGPSALRQEPVPLHVIGIIEPVEVGPAGFERLGPVDAHARLFGSTFHPDLTRDRLLPAVLDALASVVEHVPVGTLTVPRGRDGLAAAEQALRRTLAATVPGGSRSGSGSR